MIFPSSKAYPFAVEESYGGPDAFKRFVNACHQKGIAVLLDVVYNHLGPMDLPLWQFDGWSENGLGGTYFYNDGRAETPWAHTRPNYGVEAVRRYLIDSALYWLNTMHCDGLRVDGVSFIRLWGGTETNRSSATFNPEGELFLKELSAAVSQTGKILIAEDLQGNISLTEPLEANGLGFHSQWDGLFHWKVLNSLKRPDEGRKMSDLKDAILADLGGGLRRTVYVESHDEAGRFRLAVAISGRRNSWVGTRLAAMGTALVMLSPGIPLLFQGQEFALQDPFSAHHPMDWLKKTTHQGTLKLHRDLIGLRTTNQGLLGGDVNVSADEENKVLTIHRSSAGGSVFAIFNFRRQALANYPADFPDFEEWKLVINTADAQYYNSATVFQNDDRDTKRPDSKLLQAADAQGMWLGDRMLKRGMMWCVLPQSHFMSW